MLVLEDELRGKILKVDTITFTRKYKFLEDLDDIVECIETGKIYKSNYKGLFVELVEVSNKLAMEKIEAGMKDFRNQLIKEGF